MAGHKRGFYPTGLTILVAGAASPPTATQAPSAVASMDQGVQVRIHNQGPSLAFVAFGADAATALANAVIPVAGVPTAVIPVPAGAIEVITAGRGQFWTAICAAAGTASVWITPGDGI